MKIVYKLYKIGILAFLVSILVLSSGYTGQTKELVKFDRDAIPIIADRYVPDGAMYPDIADTKSVQFTGRISYIPSIMPDRGTLNILVCGDWKGKKNMQFDPGKFCGAQRSNDSGDFIVYSDPIVIQISSEKIIGDIESYSLVGITGYASPEWYILQYINYQHRYIALPLVYAQKAEVIPESMFINRTE